MITGPNIKGIDPKWKRTLDVDAFNEIASRARAHGSSNLHNGMTTLVYGLLTRPPNNNSIAGTAIKIFEVQSEATGDGVYNCYEQALLDAQWDSVSGETKLDDKDESPTSVEVLNLDENNPMAGQHNLSEGDILAAWKMTDDEGTSRWVGLPAVSGGAVRIAYCKTAAHAATSIDCYLDTDGTGTEITVNCSISGGGNLNAADPRLADGDVIFVQKFGSDWWCIAPFQGDENCICTTP